MMKIRNQRSMIEDVHSLFHLGAMGAWADGKLVAHFLSGESGCDGAFRVLLHRHGPMVLAVCRGVLGDSHAAEDAFQATFLVLVKKAGSIRDQGVLSGWLYGVALRVARKAKAQAIRRRDVERRAAERSGESRDDPAELEVRALIREEIARLPERYREPLVLCYLEGLRHHEIAERLECPVGTVESRLSRGRERLRTRLERRGVAPTASGPGLMLLAKEVSAAVPVTLVESTIRCLSGFASKRGVAEVAVASVATLAKGSGSTWPHFGPALTALVASTGIFVAGVGAYRAWARVDEPKSPVALLAQLNPPPVEPPPAVKSTPIPNPIDPSRPRLAIPMPSRPDWAVAVPLGAITVDGRLDDWPEGLERHRIRRRLLGDSNYDLGTTGPNANPEGDFRVGYNREDGRIYLAVEVEDEDLVASAGDPFHTDSMEVYVEGLFSDRSISDWPKDASKLPVVQYAAVPGPVPAYDDPRGSNPSLVSGKIANSTTKMAYRRLGNTTIYEWAVQVFDHYPDLPTQLEPGKSIGFELVVVDRDRDRPKSTWLHWGPPWAGFKGQDAGSLGELILGDMP